MCHERLWKIFNTIESGLLGINYVFYYISPSSGSTFSEIEPGPPPINYVVLLYFSQAWVHIQWHRIPPPPPPLICIVYYMSLSLTPIISCNIILLKLSFTFLPSLSPYWIWTPSYNFLQYYFYMTVKFLRIVLLFYYFSQSLGPYSVEQHLDPLPLIILF